jgi:hypothetical protein
MRRSRAADSKRARERRASKQHELELAVEQAREKHRQLLILSTRGMSRRTREAEQARVAMLSELVVMMNAKKPDVELKNKLASYRAMYSDYGEERASKVRFHVGQLRELLAPTEISKVLFTLMDHWAGEPDPRSFEGEKSVGEIWNALATELDVTPPQQAAFLELRQETKKQEDAKVRSFGLLDSLQAKNATKSESLANHFDTLAQIISTSQIIKFLDWIERNKALLLAIDDDYRRQV